MRATIFKSHQRVFDCYIEDTKELVQATAKGNLLKGDDTIVVGDYISLSKEANGEYFIERIFERNSVIFRQIQRENKKKITAANIDLLVVLMSASKPKFKRGMLDRFLLRAAEWEIPAVVIFNKMDAYKEKDFDIKFEADRLLPLGVTSYELSAKDSGHERCYLAQGRKELLDIIKGKNSIFLGQSGVGKSTLISNLSDGVVDLKTKNIGKAGKGMHTTTWSEMIDLGDFRMIDSPGIRSFSIEDLLEQDFKFLFPDLVDLFPKCEFFDCTHDSTSKGCYFNSLEEGREKDLIFSRLEAYKKLLDEISAIPDWKKTPSQK
jgi:ribosome biogenesis GTPase / thiamine phosphate phosphatase